MIDCTFPFIIVPIILLALDKNTNGKVVLVSFVVPAFAALVLISILMRRDQGGFFYTKDAP